MGTRAVHGGAHGHARWLRRVIAAGAATGAVLVGGLSSTAYATAGPRTNGDVTYYLNGQGTTVNYQTVQLVDPPCGGWELGISGGPYDVSEATNSEPYCLSYVPSLKFPWKCGGMHYKE